MSSKTELRRAMKTRRKGMAAGEKSAADAVICEKLKARSDIGEKADPLNFGSPLAVYLASSDEINIDPCIEYMLRAGVEVVAPRWNGSTYELAKLKGLDEKNLRHGPMGIREPVDADIVEPKKVSAWIIPGLAFTRKGKRLGYGGGWYDRFLASAPEDAVKIGVAYSFQIVTDLPSEPHDIPLTDVVDDSLGGEFREIAANGTSEEIRLASLERELAEWRRTNRFCGCCGAEMKPHANAAERAFVCPSCGYASYPRITPAVIALVTKGDRVLLQRNTHYKGVVWSLVAGFVDAGESLEDAVRREIREEASIEVRDVRYFGSQTWPYPSNIMIGFRAEYDSGELKPDGEEVVESGWFDRDHLPQIPRPGSIARTMLDAWLACGTKPG